MNVAFLTPEYPNEKTTQAAGIGTSIRNLVVALRKEHIGVSVFVYGQQTDGIFTEDGIKIHLIQSRQFGFLTGYQYRKFLAKYLNHYIAEDQIDIVEAPDWTGITAFMKLKAPLVIRFHGTDAYFCHLEKRHQKLKNFVLEKMGIGSAQAYIAPTDYAGKISQSIFGIKHKRIQTIFHGLDLPFFENPYPELYDKGMILYIGTLIRKKGVLELPGIFVKVLADFPEAKLVLIGGDSFDLQTQSASTWQLMQLNLDEKTKAGIEYLGKIPYEKVRDYIRRANVCVFPTFAETFGMVTVESMAMQKAVVNSNIGWSPELIDDGVNGFLVHPKDHDLFASRIVALLSDGDLCQTIGAAAKEKVNKDFDIAQLVKENIAFYKQLIKEKK